MWHPHYILEGTEPRAVDDVLVWARWFELTDRRVAKTDTHNGEVSTVFLGLNHSWDENGPPLLFETMVFGGTRNGEQERYSTWDEAIAGHAEMVKLVNLKKPSLLQKIGATLESLRNAWRRERR